MTVMVGASWPLTSHMIELRHSSHDVNRNICAQSVVNLGSGKDEMVMFLEMGILLVGIETLRCMRYRPLVNWPRQRRNLVFVCGGA